MTQQASAASFVLSCFGLELIATALIIQLKNPPPSPPQRLQCSMDKGMSAAACCFGIHFIPFRYSPKNLMSALYGVFKLKPLSEVHTAAAVIPTYVGQPSLRWAPSVSTEGTLLKGYP